MYENKEDCFGAILRDLYLLSYDILAYFYNPDFNLKNVYMYSKEDPELDTNYIFLVKKEGKYTVITGSIYNYLDNDGIGKYEFGICYEESTKEIFDTLDEGLVNFFNEIPYHYCFDIIEDEKVICDQKTLYTREEYLSEKIGKLFLNYVNSQ